MTSHFGVQLNIPNQMNPVLARVRSECKQNFIICSLPIQYQGGEEKILNTDKEI